MFMASALKVVDMMLMPAMPGTITFRFFWSEEKIAPNRPRKISGSAKLKNAAEGLRQNIRRSRRNWRQPRATASGMSHLGLVGREQQIDVFQRRPGHGQLGDGPAASQRRGGQLV